MVTNHTHTSPVFCYKHNLQIRYTGFRDRPLQERQIRFQNGCREGHCEIVSLHFLLVYTFQSLSIFFVVSKRRRTVTPSSTFLFSVFQTLVSVTLPISLLRSVRFILFSFFLPSRETYPSSIFSSYNLLHPFVPYSPPPLPILFFFR